MSWSKLAATALLIPLLILGCSDDDDDSSEFLDPAPTIVSVAPSGLRPAESVLVTIVGMEFQAGVLLF